MSAATILEHRYRRLLACYPAEHRRVYGEEMVGVLLASARPGQQRPGVAETLDMFGGGLRVRLRAALAGSPDPGWRRALALTTLIAPVLLATMSPLTVDHLVTPSWLILVKLLIVAVLLVPAALAMFGLRRVAAGLSGVTALAVLVQTASESYFFIPGLACVIVLLAVQAVALAISPGPRYAFGLITRAGVLMALPYAATAAYMTGLIPTHYQVPQLLAAIGVGVVALAGLPALASPTGRRLIILTVAIPLSGMLTSILSFAGVDFYAMTPAAEAITEFAPPALLAALTWAALTRFRLGGQGRLDRSAGQPGAAR